MFDKRNLKLLGLLMALVLAAGLLAVGCAPKEEEPGGEAGGEIILATTTSTYDSGLLDYLHLFSKRRPGLK